MISSASPEETAALGARLAGSLAPGDVVVVRGELGAGKTTFVRAACTALGVTDPVTSPTFTIGRRYDGAVPVSHLDLYRLESLAGEDPALLEDYLTPDTIAFVECPAGMEPQLDRIDRTIDIAHAGGDARRVSGL